MKQFERKYSKMVTEVAEFFGIDKSEVSDFGHYVSVNLKDNTEAQAVYKTINKYGNTRVSGFYSFEKPIDVTVVDGNVSPV